jgi:hypothetical protein
LLAWLAVLAVLAVVSFFPVVSPLARRAASPLRRINAASPTRRGLPLVWGAGPAVGAKPIPLGNLFSGPGTVAHEVANVFAFGTVTEKRTFGVCGIAANHTVVTVGRAVILVILVTLVILVILAIA